MTYLVRELIGAVCSHVGAAPLQNCEGGGHGRYSNLTRAPRRVSPGVRGSCSFQMTRRWTEMSMAAVAVAAATLTVTLGAGPGSPGEWQANR